MVKSKVKEKSKNREKMKNYKKDKRDILKLVPKVRKVKRNGR